MRIGKRHRDRLFEFSDRSRRVIDAIFTLLTYLGVFIPLILLTLWNTSSGHKLYQHLNITLPDLVGDLGLAVPLLVLIFLGRLNAHTKNVVSEIGSLLPKYEDIIEPGAYAVYPHLKKAVSSIKIRNERKLEILGMTLKTAHQPINEWIEAGILDDWTVVAYCLDPGYLKTNPALFPAGWAADAETTLADILRDGSVHGEVLEKHRIHIELRTYANLPAVHGFRLGNTEIIFSVMEWNQQSGTLSDPNHFFERIRRSDDSPRATVYRELFQNWIEKAKLTTVQTYGVEEPRVSKPVPSTTG